MGTAGLKWSLFLLLFFILWANVPSKGVEFSMGSLTTPCLGQNAPKAATEPDEKGIQWFRDEMRISPKYMERDQGILGMSWTHFFTMVFLVLFFVAALVALMLRHRRTKELLNLLLKEEGENGTDS
jgi:hypothetical protein